MRIISFEGHGQSGLGVMADAATFVSVREIAPELPNTLIEVLQLARSAGAARHA